MLKNNILESKHSNFSNLGNYAQMQPPIPTQL